MELNLVSKSIEENEKLARRILQACENSRIFAFYGHLGAGKTTLIKSFCKVLGVDEEVTSPTFTLVNEYEGKALKVYHFDFYRIKTEVEAYDLGYEEYFFSGEYCFIEWPEKIPSLLPEAHISISIEAGPDGGT